MTPTEKLAEIAALVEAFADRAYDPDLSNQVIANFAFFALGQIGALAQTPAE